MIRATKADVDQAKQKLTSELEDAAYAVLAWRNHPTDEQAHRRAFACFDAARLAFVDHRDVLTTWAAGPNGDDRG